MKNNQNLLAAGLLVILALVYYITQTGAIDTKTVATDQFSLDQDQIQLVTVSSSDADFKFELKDGSWNLDNYAVDTSRMKSFLDQISELHLDRKITSNPDKHAKYDVEDTGTSLAIFSGDGSELLNLIIGKRGTNYQETFIREVGQDQVYAVKASLSSYKDLATKNFWDRSITSFDVNEVKQIEFDGELNYSLHRNGPRWTFDGEEADMDKVSEMLRPLGNLKATNFVEEIGEESEFHQSIVITMESGDLIDLKFFSKAEQSGVLLVKASNRAKFFEYSSSGLNRYKKELSDLQPDPPSAG